MRKQEEVTCKCGEKLDLEPSLERVEEVHSEYGDDFLDYCVKSVDPELFSITCKCGVENKINIETETYYFIKKDE